MTKKGSLLFLYTLMLIAALLLACEPVPATTTPPGTISAPTETATAHLAPEDSIPRISVEELKAKYDSGADILIVDARHREEYEADHIKGAMLAPLEDILAGKWIPPEYKDREIIFYCT
jgi:hypothetical protein